MTIINTIMLALIYMIEPYIWLKCLETLGWKKDTWKHPFLWTFLGYYLLTLIKQYVVLNNISDSLSTIFTVIMITYMITVTAFLFQAPRIKKVATLGLFWFVSEVCEAFVIVIFNKCLHMPMSEIYIVGFANIFCTLVSKLLLGAIAYSFFINKKKKLVIWAESNIQLFPVFLVLSVFEVVVCLVTYYLHLTKENIAILILLFSSQAIVIFAILYFAYVYRQHNEQLAEKDAVIESGNSLDDLKHDMPFHARMLKELAYYGEREEMIEYVDSIVENLEVVEDSFHLENRFVSKVLSQLARDARRQEIPFSHVIAVEDFLLKNNEIACILSNILNNAMEATIKVPKEKRFIELEILNCPGGYRIGCINAYLEKPEIRNGSWGTTKQDKNNHGHGLKIIKKIVEKHGGIVKVVFHEKCFEIDCVIRNKGESVVYQKYEGKE